MKIIYLAASIVALISLSGCELTKSVGAMKPNYRCSKCGTEILMLSDVRAKGYCPQGGKHEWQRILNH